MSGGGGSPRGVAVAVAAPAGPHRLPLRGNRVVAGEPVEPPGHELDVRAPARHDVRLEGVVGDHEVPGERGEVRDLGRKVLLVAGEVAIARASVHGGEPVHPSAVHGLALREDRVPEAGDDVGGLDEADGGSIVPLAHPGALAPAVPHTEIAEHLVERVVLLVDDDDVPDRRAGGGFHGRA